MIINVSKEEIKVLEKLNIISQSVPLQEKIKYFEQKYECNLKEFEEKIKKEEEDFHKWDDYLEWKAYAEKLKDLNLNLKEIENAEDVKIS